MSYFTPYIDSTGLHIPTYTDIRDQLLADAKNTFGQDIYLGIDSQDYQFICAIAEKVYDSFQLSQEVYNNQSPGNAIGVGLDGLVKLNGIKRKAAVYSTCPVTLAGSAGTVISNGIAQDKNGNKWDLPNSVTIPSLGTIDVVATCETSGAIAVNVGDINTIVTPTFGWDSVTNSSAATVGAAQETDSQLRGRQAKSVATPSQSLLEGLNAAIAAVSGVTRYVIYENDTGAADSNGLPAHSVTTVVEGGTDNDIANAIYLHKGIGALTNGTTTVPIIDSFGQMTNIGFYRPISQAIDVTINVKQLNGYTSDITDQIKQNLADYLSGLKIGEDLAISSLWGIALTAMPDLKNPMFSITSLTAGLHGQAQGTTDLTIAYNQVTLGDVANITVNVS